MTEVTETATEVAHTAREYGFTLLVKADGTVALQPINVTNDFELIGLLDYANQKKHDILKVLGMSLEARTLTSIGQLASALLQSQEAQVG